MSQSKFNPCMFVVTGEGWIVDDPIGTDVFELNGFDDDDESALPGRRNKPNRDRKRRTNLPKVRRTAAKQQGKQADRVESRDGTFRCRHCKTIVGVPISGGRHRNHCPLCLYSRHVDWKRPGDRRSECRSMMRAVGVFTRGDGEQVLIHLCLGCGVERHNRVAADDNVIEVMRLPVREPARGHGEGKRDERFA